LIWPDSVDTKLTPGFSRSSAKWAMSSRFNAVWSTGPDNIWAVADAGVIVHYDGKSWRSVPSGVEAHLTALWGSAADRIYATGGGGTILRYDGSAWQPMASGVDVTLSGIWGDGTGDLFGIVRRLGEQVAAPGAF